MSGRLRFPTAKKLCGLDKQFEIKTRSDYDFALRFWRERTVAARRANDDGTAAVLSECKQIFKHRYERLVSNKCPDCGEVKSLYSMRCNMCARIYRFYRHNIPNQSAIMKTHEIEEGLVIVPPITHCVGELTAICRKLALTGQIGDSFVTPKVPSSINNICRGLGMDVIVRIANTDEKDKKKRIYRVWRADGLDMNGVNEVLRKRLAKEPVPPAKPCVPPPADALPQKHPKKGGKPGRPSQASRVSASASAAEVSA